MIEEAIGRFRRDENGATAIEYGLIAALVAVAVIASMSVLGGGLNNLFGTTETGVGGELTRAVEKL